VLDRLTDATPAIVHFRGGVFKDGHYFVFFRESRDHVLVSDPGFGVAWCPKSKLMKQYAPYMSGHFLVVKRLPSEGDSRTAIPRIPVSQPEVSLAMTTLQRERGYHDFKIRVLNDGKKAVELLGGKGSCSCFRGARLDSDDQVIGPGEEALLLVRFDKHKISYGVKANRVRVQWKDRDGGNKWTMYVVVRTNVIDGPPSARVSHLPEVLLFDESGGETERTSELVVLAPAEADLRFVRSTTPGVDVEKVAAALAAWEPSQSARIVHRFRIKVTGDAGARRGELVFDLGDEKDALEVDVIVH